MKILLSLFAVLLASTALAIDKDEPFDDPALQARYDKIIEEVRCLKCQNATIKDSPAFLATDLRREIRRMLLEGYTDSTGPEEYNLGLSLRRAESVSNYLMDNYGITSDRIVGNYYGSANPVAGNDTAEGRAINRRVEVAVGGL